MSTKCAKCGETDKSKFTKNSAKSSGLQSYCKKCHNDAQKARRLQRGYNFENLRRCYRITVEKYNEMLIQQGGVCAICGEPETVVVRGRVINLAVDHDHSCCPGKTSCGKCVRGLLCRRCNWILARWRDDMKLFEKAISYLRRG
jgi:hypothetical protein